MSDAMSDAFDYLDWFFCNCDFGPAHEDVIDTIQEMYTKETGKAVPKEYKIGGYDE